MLKIITIASVFQCLISTLNCNVRCHLDDGGLKALTWGKRIDSIYHMFNMVVNYMFRSEKMMVFLAMFFTFSWQRSWRCFLFLWRSPLMLSLWRSPLPSQSPSLLSSSSPQQDLGIIHWDNWSDITINIQSDLHAWLSLAWVHLGHQQIVFWTDQGKVSSPQRQVFPGG